MKEQKIRAAQVALNYIQSGQIVGLGSGSTASEFIKLLGEKVSNNELKNIQCIASSVPSERLAREMNLPILDLNSIEYIDVTVDGADEFDPYLNLIKGGGGALVREKILASLSNQLIIITDASKQVKTLGQFKLPVEVLPFSYQPLLYKLKASGLKPDLRFDKSGHPYRSDNGNYILDLDLKTIKNPVKLAQYLESTPGVVDHGLFIEFADVVIVANDIDIREFYR